MHFTSIPVRILVLLAANALLIFLLGRVLFSDWRDFGRQFIPEVDFGCLSWILGIHLWWQNWRLCFLVFLYASLVLSEYHFFWGFSS